MNNARILSAAANRWPQDLRECAYREWCAELVAIDQHSRSAIQSSWQRFRFVWSLLMSKPPQANAQMPAHTASRILKEMGTVLGLSFGLGSVFSWAFIQIYVYADSVGPYLWFYFPLIAATGLASLALFRSGRSWRIGATLRPTSMVIAVILGGIVSYNLAQALALGPQSMLLSAMGDGPMLVVVYGVGLMLLLSTGTRIVRKLRDHGRNVWAGILVAVSLYGYFSLPYQWYFQTYLSDVPIGVEFSAFFFRPDSDQETMATCLVGPFIPLVAFLIGRAWRKSPGPAPVSEASADPA